MTRPAPKNPAVRKARASLGNAVSRRDAAAEARARVVLKNVTAEDYIRRLVDEAPPLTPEQRARLAALLSPAVAEPDRAERRAAA